MKTDIRENTKFYRFLYYLNQELYSANWQRWMFCLNTSATAVLYLDSSKKTDQHITFMQLLKR
jgi:hypothetical protein